MAISSSTYLGYKTSTSNRHSQEADTPACATPPRPSARAKLASEGPFLTPLVPPHRHTCSKATPSKRRAMTPCLLRGCTVLHLSRSQASCTGLLYLLMSLASNPAGCLSTAQGLASTAARLPYLPSLRSPSHSHRTPVPSAVVGCPVAL
jgi:hypothetical protein